MAGRALFLAVRSYKEWAFDNEMHDTFAFSAEANKAGDSPTVEATKWLTGLVRDCSMFHPILDRRELKRATSMNSRLM